VQPRSGFVPRGAFEPLAATWSVDRAQEQIKRGAFRETIARWQASGRQVPLHWNHGSQAEDVIGSVDPWLMEATADGLRVQGTLDLEES